MGTMKPAAAVLACLIGAFAGLSIYAFDYAEGTSYLSDDPRACMNCHIMRDQFDAWQKAGHHAHATCNDCHVPHTSMIAKYLVKGEHGYRHSKGFTFQDFHEPIRITPSSAAVVRVNCVRCHEPLVSEIDTARGADHAGADCLHCHTHVGHGPAR